MAKYRWKFTMGTKKEPTWEVRTTTDAPSSEHYALVAYAKRAKNAGWFVRISGVNEVASRDDKIYIGDDVFPPSFMIALLGMNKLTN